LVLPVSANGRRYLASIQDQSLKHLSCFYQQLHDNRAKDIYLCGSRYMKEFRDILTVCLDASRGATIRQSDAQFAVILTRLSCLFRATWTATPDGTFSKNGSPHICISSNTRYQVLMKVKLELLRPHS
jgi:hypothetical protein